MVTLTAKYLDEIRDRQFFQSLLRHARRGSSMDDCVRGLVPDLREPGMQIEEVGDQLRDFFRILPHREKDVGVASFDFRLGRLVAKSDTVLGEVSERELGEMEHWNLEPGQQFEFKYDPNGNCIYYLVSEEGVSHSGDLEFEVHSKSTTGRLGCHSKGVGRTSDGRLITILQPLAFNLLAKSGEASFSQGVVRYKGTPYATLQEIETKKLVTISGGDLKDFIHPLGLLVRFDTRMAYAAKRTDEPIDLCASNGSLDWRKWWEVIEGNSQITLDPRRLYLLGSQGVMEFGQACGIISKEKDAYNGLGGLGCLAGVVQPKFRGGITMEPYFQNKTRIKIGDIAGHVLIDPVRDAASSGEVYSGDYQGQKAPRLPKMFEK